MIINPITYKYITYLHYLQSLLNTLKHRDYKLYFPIIWITIFLETLIENIN